MGRRSLAGRTVCSYERVFWDGSVGLVWKARGGERSTYDGRDADGRLYAHATNISGRWTIYLTPWACGREGGLATGPFKDTAAAMAAADEHVAAYLSRRGDSSPE
jgi:hypothetical protein